MSDEPTTYLQSCSMRPGDVANVGKMISSRFPQIRITVNPDRETYHPSLARQIPEGEVLVTFEIPRGGIFILDFYLEFSKVLNQEPTVPTQIERRR